MFLENRIHGQPYIFPGQFVLQRQQGAGDFFPFLHAQVPEFVYDFSDRHAAKLAPAHQPSNPQFIG